MNNARFCGAHISTISNQTHIAFENADDDVYVDYSQCKYIIIIYAWNFGYFCIRHTFFQVMFKVVSQHIAQGHSHRTLTGALQMNTNRFG